MIIDKNSHRWLRGCFALVIGATIAACSTPETATYRSSLTGDLCEPNASFIPLNAEHSNRNHDKERPTNNGNGNESPTGIPGDNLDDTRSGKVDCLGDGNSGQGDDKKHGCQFPQPGCDDQGCCETDGGDEDDTTPPADDTTPPADDTTPPADDTTPPADDTTPTRG